MTYLMVITHAESKFTYNLHKILGGSLKEGYDATCHQVAS